MKHIGLWRENIGMNAAPPLPTVSPTNEGGPVCATLAETYRNGGYARFATAHRAAGTGEVVLVRFSQPAGAYPDPPTSDMTLAVNERGSGTMTFDIASGRRELPFRRGDLVLKPPCVATYFAVDRPHQKRFLSMPKNMVAATQADITGRMAETRVPDFGLLHAHAFRSAAIERLLDLIWAESIPGDPWGQIINDAAILALVTALCRLAMPRVVEAPTARPLSPARLKRVDEWVAAHLDRPFGLNEMAQSVALSPFHFSRALKAATRLTPRGYVMARRLDRAKEMLADPALSLSAVAHACGFADQSHFTTAFGRATGTTPGAWRRALA